MSSPGMSMINWITDFYKSKRDADAAKKREEMEEAELLRQQQAQGEAETEAAKVKRKEEDLEAQRRRMAGRKASAWEALYGKVSSPYLTGKSVWATNPPVRKQQLGGGA